MATSGYQAAIETNATQISYGLETAWAVVPAVQFQAIRYTSETLAGTITRQRPSEISNTREAAQSVTTQVTAGGTINFAMSNLTYDDFFASCLQNPWGSTVAINGVGADISITNGSPATILTSTTSGKFNSIVANSWIRLLGFSNAANNGWWWVSVKTSGQSLTLTGPNVSVAETPTGTSAKVRSCTVKNGTTFQSLFIQQQFASDKFQTFAGAYPSRITINGGLGNYMTGAIDIVAQAEDTTDTNQSTGSILAAPLGRVIDPVGGFVGMFINEASITTGVDRFTITMENTGAASEFAMGSAEAQGILTGTFTASGSFRCFFKDFTYYDLYKNSTQVRLAFIVKDSDGASYAFTFLNAVLNGSLEIGGPGQACYANFTVEGGPDSNGNGTLIIDRLAAS